MPPVRVLDGERVTRLTTPAEAVRPPNVACGPRKPSMLATSFSWRAPMLSGASVTPSTMMATPLGAPAVTTLVGQPLGIVSVPL